MIVAVTRAEVESGEAEVESIAVDSTSVARRKDESLGLRVDGELEERLLWGDNEFQVGGVESSVVITRFGDVLLWFVSLFI